MQLEIKRASISYSKSGAILQDIDLSADQGEFIGIIGASGSGKTTLLETLSGFHKPDHGTVFFEDADIYHKNFDCQNFRRDLQIVFQFPENQFFETDVYSEIAFGLKMLQLPAEETENRIHEALKTAGLDPDVCQKISPFALSGGQKRRLAIACALAVQPKVLLLDEPFSGADAEGRKLIMKALTAENQKGKTILMVSHDSETLCELCSRIIVLSGGKIIHDGKPAEVYAYTEELQKEGITPPDTKKLADLLGLASMDRLSYDYFMQRLVKSIAGGKE